MDDLRGPCGHREAFGCDSEQPEGHCSCRVENRLEGMRVEAGDLSGGCYNYQMGGDSGLGQGSK